MFAKFDEIPAMTLQDIKKTKRYGKTDPQMDNVKTVYPPQTKFGGNKHRIQERANRSVFSQQVTTRLQRTDKTL